MDARRRQVPRQGRCPRPGSAAAAEAGTGPGPTPGRAAARWVSERTERLLAWIGLGFALSPAIAELARSLSGFPFAASYLVAPFMLAYAAWTERGRPARPRRALGAALIGAALLVELLGIVGGSSGAMRAALPFGLLGGALWCGAPRPMLAALGFWLVPLPNFLYVATTPAAEIAYAQIAAAALSGLGVEASGTFLKHGAERLAIRGPHSGVHLAMMLALLSWFDSVRRERSAAATTLRAAVWAALGIPLQIGALVVAGVLLAAGADALAASWLDDGVWMLALLVGLALGLAHRVPEGRRVEPA